MHRLQLILSLFLVSLLLAADWPGILGPTRNGRSPLSVADSWAAGEPKELWSVKIGEGYSGPVVSDGKVLVFSREKKAEVLLALDGKTGKEQWRFASPTTYRDDYGKGDGPRATPVIDGDRVYLVGAAGQMHCVELKTGKEVWQKSLAKEYELKPSFFGIGSTPVIEGKLLIANVGGENAGVVAFDKATGKEVWKASDDAASYSSPIIAELNGKKELVLLTREGVLGLEPSSGKELFRKRWRSRNSASVNASTPLAIEGKYLFFTSSYNTGALLVERTKDGIKEIWSNDSSMSCQFNTPVVVGEHLYGFHGRQETKTEFRCVEWKTGKVKWSEAGFACSSMLSAGKKLLVVEEAGRVLLCDANPEKYSSRGEKTLAGLWRAEPALAKIGDAVCLIVRSDSQVVCLQVGK
jgi:outer membrane protein assembly factor BamB